MSFLDGASALVDRLATCFTYGSALTNQLTRDEIEREAHAELQAGIDRGRPGPEEWARTRPPPAWAVRRPRALRKVEAVTVRLDGMALDAGPALDRPSKSVLVSGSPAPPSTA